MPSPRAAGSPVEVAPGLYMGGIEALDHLQQLGITHVVTVVNDPGSVQHPQLGACSRHLVDAADTEEANLLTQLPAATAWVAAARRSGARVLVHCAQGVSRSAALAAACLMAEAQLEAGAALEALRRRCPAAAPNAGFLAQLELWGAMGYRLAESYVPYKRFLLAQAAQQYHETGCLDASALSQPQEGGAGDGDGGAPRAYRCRKCRALVATQHNVVEAEQGPGASAFRWRKRDKQQRASLGAAAAGYDAGSGSSEDGSLFVEPLRWMCEGGGGPGGDSVVGGAVQGKLYCPNLKCQARLGSFNWAGTQSSSGAWVTPAFQLHMSKLDSIDPRPPAALTGIRQPRMLGSASPSPGAAAAVAGLAAQLQQTAVADPLAPAAAASSSAAAAAVLADGSAAGVAGAADASSGGGSCFRYLVLDCDGVLVDSERASCEALHQALLQVTGFDIPHTFPEDYQPVFGMDVWHCVDYYQRRFDQRWGDVAEVAARVSAVKEGIYQRLTAGGIAAFPGVAQLVAQAQALGLRVGVASSGSPEKIAHNLGISGLAPLFPDPHLIVSAKYVSKGKPAPDVYLEALRRLGCANAARALVVEDAVNGLHAAKAAGCFSVAVCTSLPAHMLAPHADLVVEHLRDLDLAAVQAPAPEAAADPSAAPHAPAAGGSSG